MEDIKSKFFKGASDVKEKFETSQELNELKREIRELEKKRTNYILELGEAAYSNFRKGGDLELPFVGEIQLLDKKIFDLSQKLARTRKLEEGILCECGNPLTSEDKFCKKCGKKVESLGQIDPDSLLECRTCKALNEKTNNFCKSCGYKLN